MNLKFGLIPELSFYLNFAILATVFSVFALLSRTGIKFVSFGILTIIYSFTGHIVDTLFHSIFQERYKWLLATLEIILLIVWIVLVFNKVI